MHPTRKNNSRRRHRRLSALAAAPAAAVGSCLVALSLNRGDPTVGAYLAAGVTTRSPAACFLARCGVAGAGLHAGWGQSRVTPVSVPSSAVTVSRRPGTARRSSSSLLAGRHLPAGDVDRELLGAPWGAAAGFDVSSRERFRCGAAEAEAGAAGVRLSMLTASAKTDGGGGVGVDGEGTRAGGGGGGGDEDLAKLRKSLSKMMLPELKAMYRAGGGKPGTLRKAELLERLSRATTLEPAVGGCGRSDEVRPAAAVSTSAPTLETVVETATSHPSDAAVPSSSSSSSSVRGHRVVRRPVGEAGGDTAEPREDAAVPVGDGSAMTDDVLLPPARQTEAGASDATRHVRAGASQIAHSSDHVPEEEMMMVSEAAGGRRGGCGGGGGASGTTGVDTMSSGPAAVMSAARARGAAAQAASARVAGTRRASDVAKANARRHSESVRVRAASAWRQSVEGQQEQQQHQRQGVLSSSSSPERAFVAEAAGAGAVGSRREQARGRIGSGGGGFWGDAAAPPAAGGRGEEVSGVSSMEEGYRHPTPRQPAHMLTSNNNAPGRRGATAWQGGGGGGGGEPDDGGYGYGNGNGNGDFERTGGGGGGGGGGGQANRYRAGRGGEERVRAAGAPRFNAGRVRLMPRMPNPWTRGGRGGAAEGLSEEGDDVVEEFLTDTMMQPSENRHVSSGDALFNRLVGVRWCSL